MPLKLDHIADDQEITDQEVVAAFATLMAAMRKRGIIRTKNVVGDLGELYAVQAYDGHHARNPITLAATNFADVDAVSADGLRFAVKAASPSSTRSSAFHLGQDLNHDPLPAFDFLVIVRVNDLLQPTNVFEFTWSQFLIFKAWSSRQRAWFLPLTKKVLSNAQVVFPIDKIG